MISHHQRACVKLRFINLQNSNADLWIFLSLLMRLLMPKTWSGLSKVGASCSLSFPWGVQPKRSPLTLACFFLLPAFRFLLSRIITNMSGVSPYDAHWRRRVGEPSGWNDTVIHLTLLPLSISSRCSRLMELLIGEISGFLDARFPYRWGRVGGRPHSYLLSQKAQVTPLLVCVFHST